MGTPRRRLLGLAVIYFCRTRSCGIRQRFYWGCTALADPRPEPDHRCGSRSSAASTEHDGARTSRRDTTGLRRCGERLYFHRANRSTWPHWSSTCGPLVDRCIEWAYGMDNLAKTPAFAG